jgi:hypothetical protein
VPPALVVLVHAHEAQGELPRQQHQVVVALVALVVPRTEHVLQRGARALEAGLLAGERNEPAGRAEAEEDGVGPAGHLGAFDVVEVDRDARLDEVARGAGRRATHAELVIVAVGAAALGVVEAGVGVLRVELDVGGVAEHLLEVGGGDVGEKLRREGGHGGRGVAQAGIEAAAAGGVGGLVAHVLVGHDLERRKLDHGDVGLRGRGRGDDLRRQQAGRAGEQGEAAGDGGAVERRRQEGSHGRTGLTVCRVATPGGDRE